MPRRPVLSDTPVQIYESGTEVRDVVSLIHENTPYRQCTPRTGAQPAAPHLQAAPLGSSLERRADRHPRQLILREGGSGGEGCCRPSTGQLPEAGLPSRLWVYTVPHSGQVPAGGMRHTDPDGDSPAAEVLVACLQQSIIWIRVRWDLIVWARCHPKQTTL
jgi:hypothetical protein